MGRSTVYTCDNPACVEMTENMTDWWCVEIQQGGRAMSWLASPVAVVLWFCSEQCLSNSSIKATRVDI